MGVHVHSPAAIPEHGQDDICRKSWSNDDDRACIQRHTSMLFFNRISHVAHLRPTRGSGAARPRARPLAFGRNPGTRQPTTPGFGHTYIGSLETLPMARAGVKARPFPTGSSSLWDSQPEAVLLNPDLHRGRRSEAPLLVSALPHSPFDCSTFVGSLFPKGLSPFSETAPIKGTVLSAHQRIRKSRRRTGSGPE